MVSYNLSMSGFATKVILLRIKVLTEFFLQIENDKSIYISLLDPHLRDNRTAKQSTAPHLWTSQ